MPSNTYPLIAREGWPVLILLIAMFFVMQYFEINLFITILLLLAFFVVLFLHRDPYQQVPSLPLAIVSPVHGTVESILEMKDPFLDRPAQCIRIAMKPWSIFSLRSAIEGKVMNQWSRSEVQTALGKTCYAFWVKTDEGDDVVTNIHLHRQRWRYHFYMQSGERLGQGQRCGFLYFGSTVEVLVPNNVKLEVQAGQRVQPGASVLASLVHETIASAYHGPNAASLARAR